MAFFRAAAINCTLFEPSKAPIKGTRDWDEVSDLQGQKITYTCPPQHLFHVSRCQRSQLSQDTSLVCEIQILNSFTQEIISM